MAVDIALVWLSGMMVLSGYVGKKHINLGKWLWPLRIVFFLSIINFFYVLLTYKFF